MDPNDRKLSIKILIANILQSGVTEENTPIIVDLLENESGEEINYLIFTLETMNYLTPALQILILDYKISNIKNFLNLTTNEYLKNKEQLIYIKNPRKNYYKLSEEDALKQVFLNLKSYPIVGETTPLTEEIDFFDSDEFIWKKCIRKYIINDIGRVVEFISEKIINIPNKPAPFSNENFIYSSLGRSYFSNEEIKGSDLIKDEQ